MSDELRPCPFCGASGAHIEHGYVDGYHGEEDRFQVECKGCDAVGPLRKYEYEAVEEWNEISAARAEGVAAGLDAMRARAEAAEDRAAQAEADVRALVGLVYGFGMDVGIALVEDMLDEGMTVEEERACNGLDEECAVDSPAALLVIIRRALGGAA